MGKLNKLLIVDASAILTTSYYSCLPDSAKYGKDDEDVYKDFLQTSTGIYTNAIYTMLKTILKIIRTQEPTYICFAFDKTRDTFRRKLYPKYKANRHDKPFPLQQQFIHMEKILENLGFKVFYSDEFEADDYAGSIARKFENEIEIVLLTKDHDYLQLVNENNHVWMMQPSLTKLQDLYKKYENLDYIPNDISIPETCFEYGIDEVKGEEGVYPNQIIDLKGIVGDSADNIPGVRGVAGKSAIPLLNYYGTIEKIYEEIDKAKNDKNAIKELNAFWKDELGINRSPINMFLKESDSENINGREGAYLSKQLATIVTNIDIPYTLEDFKCVLDIEKLNKICEEYELKSLIS